MTSFLVALCIEIRVWICVGNYKVEAAKGYQRFDWFTDTSFYWESDLYIDTLLVIMRMK